MCKKENHHPPLFFKKRTRAGWLAYVVSPLLFADFLFPLFYHQICEIYLLSFIVPSLSTRVPGQIKVYSYLYSLFPTFFRLCSSLDFILLLFPHPLFPLSVRGISPFFICCVFALSCCPLRSEWSRGQAIHYSLPLSAVAWRPPHPVNNTQVTNHRTGCNCLSKLCQSHKKAWHDHESYHEFKSILCFFNRLCGKDMPKKTLLLVMTTF